jgi:hypothetical protein
MAFQFGTGVLFVNPTGGNLAANPTPRRPLTLQDISIDFSQDLKELKGQNKVADDVAPGDIKVSGKFSFGRHDIDLYNQIMFADVRQTGTKQIAYNETHVIPTSTTPAAWVASHSYAVGALIYDGAKVQQCTTAGTSGEAAPTWNETLGGITTDGNVTWINIGTPSTSVNVANSTTFAADLGVIYASTGLALLRTSSSNPQQGYYSVSNGSYTFNAADVGQTVFINYAYSAIGGYTVQVNSQLMGYGPVFELWLAEPYQQVNGMSGGIHLFACRAGKFSMDNKRDGYKTPSVDYQAFANLAGQIAEFWNPGN